MSHGAGWSAVIERGNELQQAIFPSLHHSKEGRLRHQENFTKPPKLTQTGWFSFIPQAENHPVLAFSGGFAIFFLIARTPLLALVQGGESPPCNSFTAS